MYTIKLTVSGPGLDKFIKQASNSYVPFSFANLIPMPQYLIDKRIAYNKFCDQLNDLDFNEQSAVLNSTYYNFNINEELAWRKKNWGSVEECSNRVLVTKSKTNVAYQFRSCTSVFKPTKIIARLYPNLTFLLVETKEQTVHSYHFNENNT